jgi:hypothetical protein
MTLKSEEAGIGNFHCDQFLLAVLKPNRSRVVLPITNQRVSEHLISGITELAVNLRFLFSYF